MLFSAHSSRVLRSGACFFLTLSSGPSLSLSLSLGQPEDFTELEVLWLLTRAWNMGILLYSLAQYPEAEKWCGLGMSFLRHLGSLQESYQTQVRAVGGGCCAHSLGAHSAAVNKNSSDS